MLDQRARLNSSGIQLTDIVRGSSSSQIVRDAVNPRKPPQKNSIASLSEIRMTNMSESPAGREENGNHKAPQKDNQSNGLFVTEQ
ncbi:hypothetical protein MKW98_009265 [Papaver atlanticum]|uniref:Uncharacterized protein n=1 Tax=Papaver atlanticum TaxID=357466 RepID=A0AAD4XPQ2_9MAGN|nr:hypothetical protein MKW98_009265 [Papaver atlanticum]